MSDHLSMIDSPANNSQTLQTTTVAAIKLVSLGETWPLSPLFATQVPFPRLPLSSRIDLFLY